MASPGPCDPVIPKKTTVLYTKAAPDTNATSVSMTGGRERYVLLPLWILRTRFQDKDWYYAMNAQTGKLVGDLPMDKGRRNKFFLISFFSFGLLGALISTLVQIL